VVAHGIDEVAATFYEHHGFFVRRSAGASC
jgi:hypothetical protein